MIQNIDFGSQITHNLHHVSFIVSVNHIVRVNHIVSVNHIAKDKFHELQEIFEPHCQELMQSVQTGYLRERFDDIWQTKIST